MRAGPAGDRGNEEARAADGGGFLPLSLENVGIEFGAGEEGEKDRADPGEGFHPGLLNGEDPFIADEAENGLRGETDENLDERGRESKPAGDEAGDQRQSKNQRRLRPDRRHDMSSRFDHVARFSSS